MPPRTTIHVPPLTQQERDLLKILSPEDKKMALLYAAHRKAEHGSIGLGVQEVKAAPSTPARPAKG